MKRKLFLLVVAVLVVALTCGIVLTACNKDENNPPPPPPVDRNVGAAVALKDVVSNIMATYNGDTVGNGKKLGIDVDLALGLDDDKYNETYRLVVKGNIDVTGEASEGSEAYIGVVREKDGVKSDLFRLAFDDQYFYLGVGNEMYKINAFNLNDLVAKITALSAEKSPEDGGVARDGLDDIIGIAGNLLFSGARDSVISADGKTYTLYDLTLAGVFKFLSGVMSSSETTHDALDGIFGLLGAVTTIPENVKNMVLGLSGTIDSLIAMMELEGVTNLPQLLNYLAVLFENVNGTLVFNFDDNKHLTDAQITFDYNDKTEDIKGKYTLDIDKAYVGMNKIDGEVFDKGAFDAIIGDAEAINLLTFSMDASAVGYKETVAEGSSTLAANHYFDISVDMSIDPFALLDLIEGTDKAHVLSALKNLGYIDIKIDEVNAAGTEVVKNILRLHSETSEGYVILQFSGLGSTDSDLGGLYKFDELIDLIGVLSAPKAEAAADFNSIVDIVKEVIAFFAFDFDNIAAGMDLRISDLLDYVVEKLNPPSIAGMIDLGNIIKELDGDSDVLNIKIDKTEYGRYDEVASKDVVNFIDGMSNKSFVKEVKEGTLTLKYDPASAPVTHFTFGQMATGTFINVDGTETQTMPILMHVDYDPDVVGVPQTVTAYIGVPTKLTVLFSMFGGEMLVGDVIRYPLSGIISAQFEVTIPA